MIDPIRTKLLPARKIVILEKISSPTYAGSTLAVVTSKMLPDLGKVIAVGEGKQPIPMKAGDTIAYRQFGAEAFYLGGKQLLFVGFGDILAVIKEAKDA